MPIRKFGTEPAKVEVSPEDNDEQTLNNVRKMAQEKPVERLEPEYGSDEGNWSHPL